MTENLVVYVESKDVQEFENVIGEVFDWNDYVEYEDQKVYWFEENNVDALEMAITAELPLMELQFEVE